MALEAGVVQALSSVDGVSRRYGTCRQWAGGKKLCCGEVYLEGTVGTQALPLFCFVFPGQCGTRFVPLCAFCQNIRPPHGPQSQGTAP